ncbi:hypothetical protein AgCh_031509 [Apium graveolens]
MSETEVDLVAQVPGVVSVFQNRMLKLHTTRSWSFLENQELLATSTFTNSTDKGADVIIGVVDSGVWPESKSFNDQDILKWLSPSFSSNPADKYIILIDGVLSKVNGSEDCASRNCQSGSLDASKVKGKIVLCFNEDEEGSGKAMNIMDLVSFREGNVILSFIQSNRIPAAIILKSETSVHYTPAPVIPSFSSRGPSALTHNILKNMYDGNVALKGSGALSVAIPRELAGLHKACEQYGRLPWKRLIRPAEHLAH